MSISEKETIMLDQEEVSKSKKKGTPPGWKPAGQLPKLKAPPGFIPKWSAVHKLTERKAEGWIVMKEKDNHGEPIVTMDVNDVGSLTDALRYRDLVAIMLPKALKQERDEWHKSENREAMKGVLKEADTKLKEGGVETYTPKGQSGRVIIN